MKMRLKTSNGSFSITPGVFAGPSSQPCAKFGSLWEGEAVGEEREGVSSSSPPVGMENFMVQRKRFEGFVLKSNNGESKACVVLGRRYRDHGLCRRSVH